MLACMFNSLWNYIRTGLEKEVWRAVWKCELQERHLILYWLCPRTFSLSSCFQIRGSRVRINILV